VRTEIMHFRCMHGTGRKRKRDPRRIEVFRSLRFSLFEKAVEVVSTESALAPALCASSRARSDTRIYFSLLEKLQGSGAR